MPDYVCNSPRTCILPHSNTLCTRLTSFQYLCYMYELCGWKNKSKSKSKSICSLRLFLAEMIFLPEKAKNVFFYDLLPLFCTQLYVNVKVMINNLLSDLEVHLPICQLTQYLNCQVCSCMCLFQIP